MRDAPDNPMRTPNPKVLVLPQPRGVVVRAEVDVLSVVVGEQGPDDDEDRSSDRDEGVVLAAASGDAPVALGKEVSVSRADRCLAENAGEVAVGLRGDTAGALEKHVSTSPDALLFTDRSGGNLARSNWNSTLRRAAEAVGLPAVPPNELRQTGTALATATGATTKELMPRLGHSSPPPPTCSSTPPTPRSLAGSTPYWA